MTSTPKPEAGYPYPLGATWNRDGTNFALFSAHAERVELCLFSEHGEETRVPLPEMTDHVWHGHLPGIGPGARYGYRVHGPFRPDHGHWFNPAKLLLDPYARTLSGSVRYDPLQLACRDGETVPDPRDSASAMPRCIVTGRTAGPGGEGPERPATPWADTIIYEGHVKGMTELDESVPEADRGTFAGLAGPRMLEHLVRLGITAVELLPVQAIMSEAHLERKGLSNYWGYNSIGFFAPEPRFVSGGDTMQGAAEFRAMVDRFHGAGIEVLLDVMFSRPAEADHLGPLLPFRGIDHSS